MQDNNLEQLRQLQNTLKAREAELRKDLGVLLEDLNAVNRTMSLMRQQLNLPMPLTSPAVDPKKLEGKTYLAAIITIAKANNNRVKVLEAKDLLIKAGIAKNPKTAYQQITGTILRSGQFGHPGPGEYELVAKKDQAMTPTN